MGIRDDGESAVRVRVEAVVDESEEGGAVRGCEESVCVVGFETGGGDERARREIRVGEEEEHVVVHGKAGPGLSCASWVQQLERQHQRRQRGEEEDEDDAEHKDRSASVSAHHIATARTSHATRPYSHRETVHR